MAHPQPVTAASLVAARQRAGLTQTGAGQIIGVPLRTWQNWEGGHREMPGHAAELWALATCAAGHLLPADVFVQAHVRPGLRALVGA